MLPRSITATRDGRSQASRPQQLEFKNEVQRHAFLERLFERGIERDVELRAKRVALVFRLQLGGLDRDGVSDGQS